MLLRLLVLLVAQQGFSITETKVVSTAMFKASTAAVGFLLAPTVAQAQASAKPANLTATADNRRVTLHWDAQPNQDITT